MECIISNFKLLCKVKLIYFVFYKIVNSSYLYLNYMFHLIIETNESNQKIKNKISYE